MTSPSSPSEPKFKWWWPIWLCRCASGRLQWCTVTKYTTQTDYEWWYHRCQGHDEYDKNKNSNEKNVDKRD